MRDRAPAKVNLCLFLGPVRADGRHELVTLFESVGLFDELAIDPIGGAEDEVVCPGVIGPNLVADALAELRASGWPAPTVRVTIDKRIPIAAGMAGGSADAAALLRRADELAPIEPRALSAIAARLGADVPGRLSPGASVGTGAGEALEPVSVAPHGLLVLPGPQPLSTAEVYREADRLGLPRSAAELEDRRERLLASLAGGGPLTADLVVNDLEPASLSLCPSIAQALERVRGAGADHALVCGSGPTVIGVYWGADGPARAEAALARLDGRVAGALATWPLAGREADLGGEPTDRPGLTESKPR